MNDAADFLDEATGRIERAVEVITEFGGIPGDHHKQWVLDQALRALMPDQEYDAWRAQRRAEDCDWEEGIAP